MAEYEEPAFAGTSDELWVRNAYLRIELRRCIEVLEQIHRTTGDMLDEKRRRGPAADRYVQGLRELHRAKSNVSEYQASAEGSEGVEVRNMQEGET